MSHRRSSRPQPLRTFAREGNRAFILEPPLFRFNRLRNLNLNSLNLSWIACVFSDSSPASFFAFICLSSLIYFCPTGIQGDTILATVIFLSPRSLCCSSRFVSLLFTLPAHWLWRHVSARKATHSRYTSLSFGKPWAKSTQTRHVLSIADSWPKPTVDSTWFGWMLSSQGSTKFKIQAGPSGNLHFSSTWLQLFWTGPEFSQQWNTPWKILVRLARRENLPDPDYRTGLLSSPECLPCLILHTVSIVIVFFTPLSFLGWFRTLVERIIHETGRSLCSRFHERDFPHEVVQQGTEAAQLVQQNAQQRMRLGRFDFGPNECWQNGGCWNTKTHSVVWKPVCGDVENPGLTFHGGSLETNGGALHDGKLLVDFVPLRNRP